MTVKWSDIKAECDGYRNGFVAVFRKYEGQPTDEKDAQGRTVKVSTGSFARHLDVNESTFRRWIKNAESGAPLSGRTSAGAGPARTGQVGRQIAKSPSVAVDDKVGMLEDLMSDRQVVRAFTQKRAPKVSAYDHRAAEAVAGQFAHQTGQAFAALEVPRWFDWLKDITTNLRDYEYDEATITKLHAAVRKLMDEVEVQQFRLGMIDEVS